MIGIGVFAAIILALVVLGAIVIVGVIIVSRRGRHKRLQGLLTHYTYCELAAEGSVPVTTQSRL